MYDFAYLLYPEREKSNAGGVKWNAADICKFLDIFSNYEVLYNISHKDN